MTHRHPDTDGETYAMPSEPCSQCKAQVCTDCASGQRGALVCWECERDESYKQRKP